MRGILLIDDRNQTATELRSWLGTGVAITVAGSWSEAVDTLSYQVLAGTELPAVVLGPLGKSGMDAVEQLRSQGADPSVALYTESRSVDQDPSLVRQFRLLAIIHKPFSEAQRELVLAKAGTGGGAKPAAAGERTRLEAADAGSRTGDEASLPDLPSAGAGELGAGRASSVRSDSRPRMPKSEELPSGVQRLLTESGVDLVKPGSKAAPAEEPLRLPEPRAIAILAIDDRFSTGSLLLERLGRHGQRVSVAPSYAEASRFLEQLNSGSQGCELIIGPLSADGTAMVRECRRRNLPSHFIFYTESQSQSQDPRLPAQYGCLAIVKRDGLIEQLESVILELRSYTRRPPLAPQDRPKTTAAAGPGGKAATTRSGEIPVPVAPKTGTVARTSGIHPAPAATASAPANGRTPQSGISGRTAPVAPAPPPQTRPAEPAAPQKPPGVASPSMSDSGIRSPSRIRRSVQLPPAAPGGGGTMEVPGETPAGPPRALVCVACAQEFVAAASPGVPVRCPHCQASNKVL